MLPQQVRAAFLSFKFYFPGASISISPRAFHSCDMAVNTLNTGETVRAQREQANADILLFKIPAEVRNLIYHDVIIFDDHIAYQNLPKGSPNHVTPRILGACPQLRKETLPIFYSENTFFIKPEGLHRGLTLSWIKDLAADSFACLRKFSITVVVRYHCNDDLMLWSQRHPRRRYLNVTINRTKENFEFSSTLEIEQGPTVIMDDCLAAEATKNHAGAMLCCFRTYDWGKKGKEKMIELLVMLNVSQDLFA